MNGSAPWHDGETSNAPPRREVEAQLERIFAADGFSNADRLKTFLAVIVRNALDSAPSPTEYDLAAAVFGRRDFDPSSDAIVRRTASRLRKELATYYDNGGKDDAVIIELPKGYVPSFRYKTVASSPPVETRQLDTLDSPILVQPATIRPRRWRYAFAILLIAGSVGLWLSLRGKNRVRAADLELFKPGVRRMLARSTSEGRSPTFIYTGHQYRYLLITPDGRKLYAIDLNGSVITVFGTDDLKIVKTFKPPRPYRSAFMTRDGKHIYISSPEGGVMILDTSTDQFEDQIIAPGENQWDIAVTPDNRKLFLALGDGGLERIDLKTGDARILSPIACPINLDLDHSGTRLYVAYQCGGPGGRSGHDTVEIYDVESESSLGKINGLPMVGNRPRFAPRDEVVLLDMRDACARPVYDHEGCPSVPSQGFYLWRPSDKQVISMQSFTSSGPMGPDGEFFPTGTRIALLGKNLIIWDWARQMLLESLPFSGPLQAVAISPSENRLFLADPENGGGLLVFDAEENSADPPSTGLMNIYSGDGIAADVKGQGSLETHGGLSYAPGLRGQAFHFNGRGAFLSSIGGSAFCFACKDSWSASLFVKFESLSGIMTILNRDSVLGDNDIDITKSSDNHIVLSTYGQTSKPVKSSAAIVAGRWYHLAIVNRPGARALYLDGVLQGTTSVLSRLNRPPGDWLEDYIFFGATQGKLNFFNGLVDEVSVYSRQLTAAEIQTMAQFAR